MKPGSRKTIKGPKITFGLTFTVCLVLAAIPFIQLGYQYYLSAMTFSFLLVAGLLRLKDILSLVPLLVLILILMLLPSLFYFDSYYALHNFLRAGREWLCFSLIYVFLVQADSFRFRRQPNLAIVNVGLGVLIGGLLGFVIIQYVFLQKGIAVNIPAQYYILNGGNIPTELDLRWSHVRPSGPFGEPSYLGFVMLSLLVIVVHTVKHNKIKFILVIATMVTVLFANTLSGILSCSVLALYFFWRRAYQGGQRFLLAIVGVAAVGFVTLSGYNDIAARLANLNDKNVERSGYQRIVVPLKAAMRILSDAPLGIPSNELSSTLNKKYSKSEVELEGQSANALLNLIINYGVVGILILFLFVRAARKNRILIAYVLFASMFNGGILTFDKAAIIGLAVLLISISAEQKSEGKVSSNPSARPSMGASGTGLLATK